MNFIHMTKKQISHGVLQYMWSLETYEMVDEVEIDEADSGHLEQ